jgi:hypothetical protein
MKALNSKRGMNESIAASPCASTREEKQLVIHVECCGGFRVALHVIGWHPSIWKAQAWHCRGGDFLKGYQLQRLPSRQQHQTVDIMAAAETRRLLGTYT